MPGQLDTEPAAGKAPADLPTQIGAAISSVWARYTGDRPIGGKTQLDGTVVRWVLADGTVAFEQGMAAEPEEGAPPQPPRTLNGFKREASVAVAKATRSKVVAMISSHDAKTGVATETFILEPAQIKY